MTFGIHNIIGIHRLHAGQKNYSTPLVFKSYRTWPSWQRKAFDYLIWCHLDRAVEFFVALICWLWLFPLTFPEAHQWQMSWVCRVISFNIVCELMTYSFWHWITHARRSPYARGPLHKKKFNAVNPYEDKRQSHLSREITYTTLGWLQSSFIQCVFMWFWASGHLSYYNAFWSRPFFSILMLLGISYWSAFHFYWIHRLMHPWYSIRNGIQKGDLGAFLYRHFHNLHHQSHNPGPWTGLSMHPVEHFFYYTRVFFPLLFCCHPLHFLYAKFQADIGPITGHDGHDDPAGGAAFHYLHHAHFECNYGVPLLNFDRLFGTYKDFVRKPLSENSESSEKN